MDELTYRGYEAGDFEAMFRLDGLCFDPRFRFSRRAMKRFAEATNARTVIAEADGGLVGFCIVHPEAHRGERAGYVVTLDVAPEWRHRGVAGRLMRNVEAEAAAVGCAAMLLHVFTENAAAIRFYESKGYRLVGRAEAFYGGEGMDAFLYCRELDAT